MFGEYAQIATYLPSSRDSSGAGDFPAGSLPPHLLPPPSVSQPLWAGGGVSRRGRGPDFTEDRSLGDFIMVAEFSEIEGPKPVVSVSFLSKEFDLVQWQSVFFSLESFVLAAEFTEFEGPKPVVSSSFLWNLNSLFPWQCSQNLKLSQSSGEHFSLY